MDDPSKPVTRLLREWSNGSAGASDELFQVVYSHLRVMAARYLRSERPGHTLAPTALVNEAYVRLADADVPWQDRAHFFAVCANVMRRILVDHAKQRGRKKRGDGQPNLALDEAIAISPEPDPRIILLDEALTKLAEIDPRKSQLIELLFFGGFTLEETGRIVGGSPSTLHREVKFAKAWILNEIGTGPASPVSL